MTCKGIIESKRSPTPDRAAYWQGLRKHHHLFWKKIRLNWINKNAKKKKISMLAPTTKDQGQRHCKSRQMQVQIDGGSTGYKFRYMPKAWSDLRGRL